MRDISCAEIAEAVARLCVRAATFLTPDLAMQLECASETEPDPAGRRVLEKIVENFMAAGVHNRPICPQAGQAVVFAQVGQAVQITGGSFADAVNAGVRKGCARRRLDAGVVRDPFRRGDTGDNTPAVLYTQLVPGTQIRLTVAFQDSDGEEKSAMRLFAPSTQREQVENWIVQVVQDSGAGPHLPAVVGVGIGGDGSLAAQMAKFALTKPVDRNNADPFYGEMERRTLAKINRLGLGPGGAGGHTTAVAVNVEAAPTHTALLPCVVCLSGPVTRHAACVL